MAIPSRIQGDQVFAGAVKILGEVTVPSGSFDNADIAEGADIDADKMLHRLHPTYGQANSAAVDETKVIYVAQAAGTVLAVEAGSIAKAVGDATCTVDVKKNGTTILGGVITLDSGNTNRVVEAGTVSVTSYAAGDVFEVVIDGTIGTGTLPTGVFVTMQVEEDPD